MEIIEKATVVFEKNWQALKDGWRIIINEGGTGSSKTYSIAQIFFLLGLTEKNKILTIARKTMPALKATAMRDFFNILKKNNCYNPDNHNKSDNTYQMGSNLIEFISVDEPLRVRSRRRNYLWLNEANEFSLEDWRQLSMRTSENIFLDYNPSYQFHWIYDEIIPRKDCLVIKSTYKDNPFLEKEIIKEIEHLKEIDENYWRIYGLGLRGVSEALIYSNWEYCDELPEGEIVYGLDFGYNNPSALVKAVIKDEGWYVKEMLYKKFLTNSQLIDEIKKLNIPTNEIIYCDSSEPQRIAEIKNAGFWAEPAEKDVKKGIDTIKSRKLFITKDSVNLLTEIKRYSWKKKEEQLLDEPVKVFDHLCDAMRYAIYSWYIKNSAKVSFSWL